MRSEVPQTPEQGTSDVVSVEGVEVPQETPQDPALLCHTSGDWHFKHGKSSVLGFQVPGLEGSD